MALWHATLLGSRPLSQSEASMEWDWPIRGRGLTRKTLRPKRQTIIKFRRRGKSIIEARGKVSVDQEDFRVRSETGFQVQSGVRESVRLGGEETVIILSQHAIHCSRQDWGTRKIGDKVPVNRTWLETGNCQNKQWSVPFAVWEVWSSSSANQRPEWRSVTNERPRTDPGDPGPPIPDSVISLTRPCLSLGPEPKLQFTQNKNKGTCVPSHRPWQPGTDHRLCVMLLV